MSEKFEVEFFNGTRVIQDAANADEAKARARHAQRLTVPADTPRSAPEVKIKSVTLLEADSSGRPSRGSKLEG